MDFSSSGKRWFVAKNAPTKQCSSSHTNCTYSQCYATYNLLAGTGKLHWFVLCFRICEAWTDISRGRTLPGQLGQGTLKAAEGSGWCHISILQLVNVLFVVGWDVYWEDNTNCSLEFPQSSKCNCEAQRLCPDILLIVVSTAALQHSGLVSSSVIGRMTCWNTTRMFCQGIFWRMWRQRLCLSLSSWWWKWEVVLAMSMFFPGGCKRTWAAVHWAGLLQHKICMLSCWPMPKIIFQDFAFRYSFAFNFKQFLFSELACDLDPCLFTRLKCLRDCQSWSVSHRLTSKSLPSRKSQCQCQRDLQRQCSWFLISPRRTPLYSSFCQGAAGRFTASFSNLLKFVDTFFPLTWFCTWAFFVGRLGELNRLSDIFSSTEASMVRASQKQRKPTKTTWLCSNSWNP